VHRVLTFAASDPEREIVGPLGFALVPLAVICALAYAAVHRRSPDPVIPRGVLRGRTVWSLLVSLLVGVALVAVVVDVPLLARLIHEQVPGGSSPATEGAFILVRFLLAVPVGAVVGGALLRRLGDGLVSGLGLVLATIGLAVMTTYGRGSFADFSSYAVLALAGFGIGLALAPVNNAALADAPQDAHGTASALVVVAVRRRPYSVVLLDEVEKAHPETFDILLQVLDDGRLTDGQGRTVDFRNVILVLTSNIGSQFLIDPTLSQEQKKDAVMSSVRAAFKPEFLNRLDDVIIFDALSQDELAHIVDLQVRQLATRLRDRRITLDVTDAARDWLAKTGYDPAYGARPLRRLVQREIGDRLARAVLAGHVRDGDTVTVGLDPAEDALTLA